MGKVALCSQGMRGGEGYLRDVLVAIPTKDKVSIIPLALYSISQQTFRDFDLLIYDDGKYPVTESYVVRHLLDFLQIHRGIEVVHKRGSVAESSLTRARLTIFEYALERDYKFLLFQDDDAIPEPNALERLLETMRRRNAAFTDSVWIDVNNILGHKDYSLHVVSKAESQSLLTSSPWTAKFRRYEEGLVIERDYTMCGFTLFNLSKIEESDLNVLKNLGDLPAEIEAFTSHITKRGEKGYLVTDAVVYHFPHPSENRDWYNVLGMFREFVVRRGGKL